MFVIARSFSARVRGLLCTRPGPQVLVLVPCCDVHTFGMRYALDIAFVDASGRVAESHSGVPPGARIKAPGAFAVLERASSPAPWFAEGDCLDDCLKDFIEKGRNHEGLSCMPRSLL